MSARPHHVPLEPRISSGPLPPAASDAELLLHQAALEWSLVDPIIIQSAADIKSSPRWQDRVNPFHHQMQNLMTFCRRLPVTLIADDVGLGKTISAGLVLSELMARRRVNRVLVICPSILCPQWVEELETKFGIFGRHAVGAQLASELRRETPVVVTTYESGSKRFDSIEPGTFDMLILDEAHKLRNLYGTDSPPKMAERVRRALEQRLFKYVLMLTATPIQNRLWDMYSLVDCLAVARGHANPLGSSSEFQRRYIADGKTGRELKPDRKEEFRGILSQYLVRTRRDQVKLSFPQREVRLISVPPTRQELRMQSIVADHIEGLPGFQQSSLLQAMMSSPAALLAQLRNMSDRRPEFEELADEVKALQAEGLEPAKLRGLLQIVDDLRRLRPADWRLVVFTTRKETQRIIGEALERDGITVAYISGDDPPQRRFQSIKDYSANPPVAHVIVSLDSGAEGVNLQAGNVLVNYDLPWNPMIVEQRIGRVQRLASKFGHVVILNLAVAGSPEARVVARLMQKLQAIADTVGDIETILEASSKEGRDDAGSSFEAQIRKLVVKSLIGQDVERATAQAEASIHEARELFERQRQELDEKLGDLRDGHTDGPSMPKLTPVSPRMPFPEFVRQALSAEGASIVERNECRWIAKRTGQPDEDICLDEQSWNDERTAGVFMGRSPKLYVPGKPAFERLVERWVNRSAQRIMDLTGTDYHLAEDAAKQWIAQIPGAQLVSVAAPTQHREFQGSIVCRVVANNATDSYEKLISVNKQSAEGTPLHEEAVRLGQWSDDEVDPQTCVPALRQTVAQAVGQDADIRQFSQFYADRLDAEYGRAGGDPAKERKVVADLQPVIHAQVLAAQGIFLGRTKAKVEVAIDGESGYRTELEMVPAARVVKDTEPWAVCDESHRRVPAGWLDWCAVSKRRVLRHLLGKSEVSSRPVLHRLLERCGLSGKLAAPDEFFASDVSGKRAASTEFVVSAVGGRRGLPLEVETCEFTQARILEDEVSVSEVSGKRYRIDERVKSAVSGRTGHRSEFVTCSTTGDTILPVEAVVSDIDGKSIRSDVAMKSAKPPHRIAAPQDVVRCELSGLNLLRDEVGKCAATNRTVDRDLLVACAVTGRPALAEALVKCTVTGQRILPSEATVSSVSGRCLCKSAAATSAVSRRVAAPDEMAKCEITGIVCLPDELVKSDISGRPFRQDQIAISEFSGRRGHSSEASCCGFSGKRLLLDEAATSEVSGTTTARTELVASEKSGRRCHRSELIECAATGRRLARDEVGRSAVSGKLADVDRLVSSPVSGKRALADELVQCQQSGARLLPTETGVCAVTGKRVDLRLLGRSEISGARALFESLVRCAASRQKALPSEVVRCQLTGATLLPEYTARCEVSGAIARRDRLVPSAVSGRLMVPQRAAISIVDRQLCCPDEAAYCHWNEGHLLPRQADTCARTQLTFTRNLLDETGEFVGLKRVLLNHQVQLVSLNHLIPALKQANRGLSAASRAWGIVSPKGGIVAACVELSEYLGIRVRYTAMLISVKDAPTILGRVTVQANNTRGWEAL